MRWCCVGVALILACSWEGGQELSDAEIGELRVLGYATQVDLERRPGRSGVTVFDRDRAAPGSNVYCSVRSARAHVLDMSGRSIGDLPVLGGGHDCLLEATPGGGVLVLSAPVLSRLDAEGQVVWSRSGGYHHDVWAGSDGLVYALADRSASLARDGRSWPVRDSVIRVLDEHGEPRAEWSLLSLVADRIAGPALEEGPDVIHANSLSRIEVSVGLARKGWFLVSLRELDLVALVDAEGPAGPELRWAWGPGELEGPHHATLLSNGHVLIFDNGARRGFSRIVEVDPASNRIVWEYRADPPESFFSEKRGGVQPLDGGHLLITESGAGRVFEITRDGEIVWEFLNPEFDGKGRRKQIYRLVRWAGGSPGRAAPTTITRTGGGS